MTFAHTTHGVARPRGNGRPAICAALLALLAVSPIAAAGQRPAELVGRVAEPGGAPVEGAHLELAGGSGSAFTDATGRYRLRAASAGVHALHITRLGYREAIVSVDLTAGATIVLDIRLLPDPVALNAVDIVATRQTIAAMRVDRAEIERSGAQSVGDVVRDFSGAIVRSTTPGGPQTVSVRGSGAAAVLVMIDGVILNDPITGEADLSTIAADGIDSVVLLTGAQSARYGPRAEAGVILIETRRAHAERSLRASVGSLGARSAGAVWSGNTPIRWSAGTSLSALDGDFDFTLPAEVGGGERRRDNADVRAHDVWLDAATRLGGGELRTSGSAGTTARGLPGRGYAPSRAARQELERVRASAVWRRLDATDAIRISLSAARQETRFRDPAPPFGLPYDDTATAHSLHLRADAERQRAGVSGLGYGAGLDARWQWIDAGVLAVAAPSARVDAGAFAHATAARTLGGGELMFAAQLRLDRDPQHASWFLNRSITAAYAVGSVHVHLANRSSYSPPTLGDQYFRDAAGVQPNPDLRAERVPSEVEAGVRGERELGRMRGMLTATLFRADIRDMIVWLPDYRFMWSPRNVDVRRRGAELHGGVESLDSRLRLDVSHSWARTTYDRGSADAADVQVVYRPRHTSTVGVAWRPEPWTLSLDARYTGARNPVPAAVNTLPGFWTVSAAAATQVTVGSWLLSPAIRVDRLFDEDATLIFGFPEPGRTLRIDLSLRRTSARDRHARQSAAPAQLETM